MRIVHVGDMKCGDRCPVKVADNNVTWTSINEFAIGDLIDFYRGHHRFCSSRNAWVPYAPPPVQPACCPPGDCRGTCSGLAAVMSNASTLLESMTAKPCIDVVTVALAKKYAGEALAHLTADGSHDVESNDPADVRLARAVRVLSEFVTRIDPPKDHS